jgi:hypothetical protein
MKKLILSLVAITTIALSSFGQAPEGFKYQAVVRDAGNTILNNQAVGIRMTIQQGSIGGTTVYQETFAPTTNAYGLVNLEIGNGTVVSGTFASIDWANGPYFIETAVDVTGGTSYAVMGTSQLMSVPYALYAKTSGSSIPGPQGPTGPQGPAGNDGAVGATGATGPQGPAGNDGLDGAQGPAGPAGPQGPTGLTGAAGVDGATGPQGPAGNDGADGAQGPAGPAGPQGPAGNDGATGATGPQGPAGNDGAVGPAGPQGPQGPAGNDGVGIAQTLSQVGGTITLSDGGGSVNIDDTDPTNELQQLSVSATDDTLYLQNGGFVIIPGISAANPPPLAIGDSYQGGIIFYLDGSGGGLIAAPTDQSAGAQWGCYGTTISGADGTAIGTGAQNTIDIETGCTTQITAAEICSNLQLAGYTDWYLPSKDELDMMYVNLHMQGLGGFSISSYWSSTEYNNVYAWKQIFSNGWQDPFIKSFSGFVRAVRAF